MFRKSKEVKIEIVEVAPLQRAVDLNEESRETVLSLRDHPGWRWLMAKMRLEKALLQSRLVSTNHTDLTSVVYLQSGIRWIDYLERTLAKEGLIAERKRSEPNPDELAAFKAAMDSIVEVGSQD